MGGNHSTKHQNITQSIKPWSESICHRSTWWGVALEGWVEAGEEQVTSDTFSTNLASKASLRLFKTASESPICRHRSIKALQFCTAIRDRANHYNKMQQGSTLAFSYALQSCNWYTFVFMQVRHWPLDTQHQSRSRYPCLQFCTMHIALPPTGRNTPKSIPRLRLYLHQLSTAVLHCKTEMCNI